MTTLISRSLFFLLLLLTAPAYAQPDPTDRDPARAGERAERLAEALQLSDEQRTEFTALNAALAERLRALPATTQEERRARRATARQLMTDYHTDLRELLTPEQYARFEKIRGEAKQRRGRRGAAGGRRSTDG